MGRLVLLGLETEGISSRVWQTLIAVNDDEISYYDREGSIETKRTHHVDEVAKGI